MGWKIQVNNIFIILYYNKDFIHFHSFQPQENLSFTCWDFDGKEQVMEHFLGKHAMLHHKNLELVFYEDIKDIYSVFRKELIVPFFIFPEYKKKRNYIFDQTCLFGNFQYENDTHIFLKDLSGWDSEKKIENMFSMVGYSTQDEQDFSNNSFVSLEKTERLINFLSYELNGLKYVHQNMIEKVNELIDIFHFPKEFLLTPETIPNTTGGIVANILEKFIYNEMCSKNGQFDLENFKVFDTLNKSMGMGKTPAKLTNKNLAKRLTLNNKITKNDGEFLLNCCNSNSLIRTFYDNSGILNSLVHGGRTRNERHNEFFSKTVGDLDFVSCYGNALREFQLPIRITDLTRFHQ